MAHPHRGVWAAAKRCALHLAGAGMLAIGATAIIPGSASAAFMPVGPQNDVPVATVTGAWGWSVCYSGTYNQFTPLAPILAGCGGDNLMLAARPVGSETFDVLAAAPYTDVVFDTGFSNTTHTANGSEWYYSSGYSWGFAGAGDTVIRGSCDFNAQSERDRLCWHTEGGLLAGGWRSGSNVSLNGASNWERVILTSNISEASTPEPGTLAMIGVALAGLVGARRRASGAGSGIAST